MSGEEAKFTLESIIMKNGPCLGILPQKMEVQLVSVGAMPLLHWSYAAQWQGLSKGDSLFTSPGAQVKGEDILCPMDLIICWHCQPEMDRSERGNLMTRDE